MIKKPETKILGNVVALMIGISLMVVGYTTVLKADTMDTPIYGQDPDSARVSDNGTIIESGKLEISSNMMASLTIGAMAFIVGCVFSVGGVILWPNKNDRNNN